MTGRSKIAPGSWGEISYSEGEYGVDARARVRRVDGSYVKLRRRGKTRSAARTALIAAANEAASKYGSVAGLTAESTVAALIEEWHEHERQQAQLRPQSLAKQYWSATQVLAPVLGRVSIGELTVPICEQAYRAMLEPRRPRNSRGVEYGEPRSMESNARSALWVLRKIVRRAVTLGLRPDNPADAVRPRRQKPREVHALAEDGVQHLRAAVQRYNARDDRSGPPLQYLEFALDVMVGTGTRIGEALALRAVEDVDLTTSPLTVRVRGTLVDLPGTGTFRQGFPKTEKSERDIQVPKWLDDRIRQWLADPVHADQHLLFQTRTGNVVSMANLRRSLRKVRAWAELPDWVIPHVLRKSVATRVTGEHGTDDGMRIMGQSDIRTLEKHYDKRGTVHYGVTSALEGFGAGSADLDRELTALLGAQTGHPTDVVAPDVTARITDAEREADAVLGGMAAAMGVTPDALPPEIRIGVRASVLGKAFSP
ncbi:MAG: tyrosine-type recombinase/integrase [Curtobacterium sp.]